MRRVLLASAVIAGLSLSGSVTLAADERESFEVAHGNSPRIGADANGHIHVVYQAELKDSDIEHVFYRRSDDHGKTWTEPKDISQIKDGAASHARIAIEKDGAVDVVWLDTIPGEKENDVFFVRSADGGKTWGTPIDVSCTPGASSEPCIAVGPDGNVHVAWVDGPAKSAEIFYAVSDDHGSSWSKGYDVSHTPGTSSSPAIAVSGEGTVHVSWVDTTSGVKHPDIFYARKPAKGDWTKSINVSNSAHVSAQPAIAAVKGDKAYLVWSDNSAKENASDI